MKERRVVVQESWNPPLFKFATLLGVQLVEEQHPNADSRWTGAYAILMFDDGQYAARYLEHCHDPASAEPVAKEAQ